VGQTQEPELLVAAMATHLDDSTRIASADRPQRVVRLRYALRAEPVHDLERVPSSVMAAMAAMTWRATGIDPQFVIDLPRGGLPAGWYLFEAEMWSSHDRLSWPCLYVDYGAGVSEEDCLLLTSDPELRRVYGVVCFRDAVRWLRLDPSNAPCEFILGGVHLRRLGRLEAAYLLLGAADEQDFLGRLRECLDAEESELDRLLVEAKAESLTSWFRTGTNDAQDYQAWIRAFDGCNTVESDRDFSATPADPLISILLPVFNTPERWLRRCIESVLTQRYPHWELCIADDASTHADTKAVLESYVAIDSRIRMTSRVRNGHISAASNSALALARGQYVALLDHDDELHPLALFHIANSIRSDPDAGLIYTDEDKIDASGIRFDPYFKPDWNPDLFLAHNMISHLGVYRTELVRSVGGFRTNFEGSQDYDLALRCIERLQPGQIRHVPMVLYHWRAVPGSTALAITEKHYAADAAIRAIREHLARTGSEAEVSLCPMSRQIRVRYRLPDPPPMVSLVVPTRDQVDLLRRCVDTLLHCTDFPQFEVIIVDNGSERSETHDYLRRISRDDRVRVLPYDAPFNFSAINNFAVREARGSLVGLVNNDVEVIDEGWLREMVSHACRPEIGAVGAKLLYPDNTIQHAGVILGIHGVAAHPYSRKPADHPGFCNRARLVQNLSAVTGACLVVRKSVYEEAGGLDEDLAVAFNDVDFCLRVRSLGYRNLWTPYATLYHHESISRGADDSPTKRARFVGEVEFMRRRWGDLLDNDPAYNPNLTRNGEPFSFRSVAA
jgi:GT2 family glycosyltransferase